MGNTRPGKEIRAGKKPGRSTLWGTDGARRPWRLQRQQAISEHQPWPASGEVLLLASDTEVAPATGVVSRNVMGNTSAVDRGVDWAPGTPSTVSAVCAIAGGVSAAQAPADPERTYGNEKVRSSCTSTRRVAAFRAACNQAGWPCFEWRPGPRGLAMAEPTSTGARAALAGVGPPSPAAALRTKGLSCLVPRTRFPERSERPRCPGS